jgi:oligosaccharyl transferase (archaeosortase A-associated)
MSDVPVIRSLSRPGLTILFILLLLMGLSFVLHALPVFQMNSTSLGLPGDPDVWYNFRQIEAMVSDFPRYNWFDPMTAYPSGKIIDWGPLFPLLSALLCLATGALQRPDILAVSSWIPVILGILVIPVVYAVGKSIAGGRTGLIAAAFIAVISGEYFYRSMFGVVDHHIAEVLFSTLFCLFYIMALVSSKDSGFDFRKPRSLLPLALPSFLAGVSLALGLAVMPTLILFAMIVGIYAVLQYSWNIFHGTNTDHLVVVNGIVAACAIAAFLVIGSHSPVYSLATYSMAPIHAFVLLFLGTVLLSLFTHLAKGKPFFFIGLVAVTVVAGGSVGLLMDPSPISTGIGATSSFFGQSYAEFPIVEQKPWSLMQAWGNFNIGIILAGIGLILLSYTFYRKECPAHLFVITWSAIVLIATLSHVRFEYYSAIVIAILSAYILGYAFILDHAGTRENRQKPGQKSKKKERSRKKNTSAKNDRGFLSEQQGTGTSLVIVCMVVFCGISLINDYSITEKAGEILIPGEWVGALRWMEAKTPDPGIPYNGPYTYPGWQYPPESYGVLSWWDYGHWITFIAQRVPVTNPFQDHVNTAAAFFLAESEEEANMIVDEIGARFVITDSKMAGTKFPAMVVWYNTTLAEAYYFMTFDTPGQTATESPAVVLLSQPYYQTMVSRLQNFDGSLRVPGSIMYTEYSNPRHQGGNRILSVQVLTDSIGGKERIAGFSVTSRPGIQAALMGIYQTSPVEKVSALRHYRLVYEEAGNGQKDETGSPHSVKVFEYVRGARVTGEGLIEVSVATNTGRVFVYQQESENGWFILPYPTDMPDSPVHALGPYRFAGSGRALEVTEHDIREGNIIGM